MLSDWESHNIPPFKLPDMSPRHAPETLFRPHTVNVQRDQDAEVVIVSISGNRLFNGTPHFGWLDTWEWDRDRDPREPWIDDLIAEVVNQ
ncbi:Uncharacterised protein [Mycobacteroides abscessus subsp. bolletii]|uniref:Uncharacterized protein n=2 Tax=Mycobacteroides abscessus TaxID=36809 RepID=A0A9Q7SA65_9MYCO|nr:Uncharacterised protein [Mycobacteroides abscessus subsp. bolletii]SIC64360.1 Uncharacterised protein [Mycobacteroides abscessus subsp. abscessus]SHU03601.1 Uncharacterised protein [Mycobacteroides abscessus subsp. bolletii]SHW82330.1 Uncharacterised protein [Mycobacteroides abscessus subsp. bolletii]SKL85667.1 Uncharacterised protein [Mycobacteroides abscessus subsp. bolletii]